MFSIHRITSLDLPELEPYRTLKRSAGHEALGIFVAEGEKVVRQLLQSDFGVVSVLLLEKRLAELEPLLRARMEKEIPIYVATDKSVLAELIGFELFQGVLAVGKIPGSLTMEEVFATSSRPFFFAAVDELSNAENIGALVRNCAAFGVQALLVGETSSSPFVRRTVRNSMGTIFRLPVVELNQLRSELADLEKNRRRDEPKVTLVETLRNLRTQGVRCIAAHPHASGKTLAQADFTSDCCLVFGSEGNGISAAVLAACDEAVAIPMANGVDSLNVGAAAAAFLYEVQRQRGFT